MAFTTDFMARPIMKHLFIVASYIPPSSGGRTDVRYYFEASDGSSFTWSVRKRRGIEVTTPARTDRMSSFSSLSAQGNNMYGQYDIAYVLKRPTSSPSFAIFATTSVTESESPRIKLLTSLISSAISFVEL